jgi:hypothetical protein
MGQVAGLYRLLGPQPEVNLKQIRMMLQKYSLQWFGQPQKIAKFLRENIVFSHIKPGLGSHLIIIAGSFLMLQLVSGQSSS